MSKIGSLLSFVQKSFVECLGFFCTMVGNRWYDMVMISYLGINLYSGIKGDRGVRGYFYMLHSDESSNCRGVNAFYGMKISFHT